MRINHFILLLIVLMAVIFFRPIEVRSISVETGFHYTQGDYGTDQTTTHVSFPLKIRGQPLKSVSMEMTIPYLYQKNGVLVSVGSNPGRGNGGNNPGQGKARGQDKIQQKTNKYSLTAKREKPDKDENQDNPFTEKISSSEHGIGDITLLCSYNLYNLFIHLPLYIPTPDICVGLKLPTANSEKGLGTGEYDYTLGFTLSWNLRMIGGYLYIDHTWVGDTPGEDFENVYSFGCGTDIALSTKNTLLIDLSGCTALYSGNSPSLSLQGGIKRIISHHYWIHCYGLVGLNEESADYGLGASLGISFGKP